MTGKTFLKEKLISICSFIVFILAVIFLGLLFQALYAYIVIVVFLACTGFLLSLGMEYYRKKAFYQDLEAKLQQLDKKYLIAEMMECPEFPEGKILYETLYETDKSMNERINEMEDTVREFKEYIEMWIHQIKLPIAGLTLMNYNKNYDEEKQRVQLHRLNHYVEQILFFARADAPQKDYLLKKTRLEDIVNKAVAENKDLLIDNKFQIRKQGLDAEVYTDSKWMIFMLGQVIHNSIKYKKEQPYLLFQAEQDDAVIRLTVEDHGVGIPESDIGRIFDKTFTGENGRKHDYATGMGLFICKKLCNKMGHKIYAESEQGEYTRICFEFGKNPYYDTRIQR